MDKPEESQVAQIEAHIFATEWFLARPPAVQALFREFPPWGFYVYRGKDGKPTDTDGMPVRHYGVMEYADDTFGFHTYTAHIGWVNETVGGAPADSLHRVAAWSPEQLGMIHTLDKRQQQSFLVPLGFAIMIEHHE